MSDQPISEPPVGRGGFRDTIGLIVSTTAVVLLTYLAGQFGTGDNQFLRLGLWIFVILAAIYALVKFLSVTKDYEINLLTMGSTWWMLLTAILIGILLLYGSHGSNDYSTFDMVMFAAILVLSGMSLIYNISKTNLLFGAILTAIQLVFSILVIAIILSSFNSGKKVSNGS